MTSHHSEHPPDLAACHALIDQLQQGRQDDAERMAQDAERMAELEAMLAQHQETVADQQQTIENLQADNQLLKRSLFGSRRERYVHDPSQQLLFEATVVDEGILPSPPAAEDAAEPAVRPNRRTSRGRRPRVFPDFLPREEERHPLKEEEIPEELRNHPDARRFYKKVGERLELDPAQLKVIEVYQETIAADQPNGETTMVTAGKPPPLINAFAGPSIWASLTVSRFADHLPYYRLEDIFGRSGFRIHRSTQWRWMQELAAGVTPLVELMRQAVLQSLVLGVDETPVKMLGGIGKALTAYLWAMVGDAAHPYDCFFFTANRSRAGPNAFLSGFRGYLQADAYVGYDLIQEVHAEILKVSCWAHARRKFEEVHHLGPTERTHMALAYIQRLYDIEHRFLESSDGEREAARQQEAQPIVETFHQWLSEESAQVLPKSKIRGAMNYMLNRWDSFSRYLESGAIPIDNNRTEATLKYAILGRKAWLFVGNPEAGETAANLFTLTKTCNRLRIDPWAYLQDVYRRLPAMSTEELPSLLPDRWLAEHPQHLIQQRVQESLDRARRTAERRAARRRVA